MSESESEVRERSRTYIKGASKKEIEESLPFIPEVKYPDLTVKREDSPMFKVCRLTPAEEQAMFKPYPIGPAEDSIMPAPPPSKSAEDRSKAIEEKVKRNLADCKALEKPPSWVDLTVEEEEVKPSRGSQTEGKHRAFEELTQEAYKEYLKEERRNNLRICEPTREQMIRESIQNYPECSNFTIQGRPLSDDRMKNIMADGFQSARAMHRKNQKAEVIDLTKNDDN